MNLNVNHHISQCSKHALEHFEYPYFYNQMIQIYEDRWKPISLIC